MTMENKNRGTEQFNKANIGGELDGAHQFNSSRRKFAQAGLGVSAFFTLTSRPVLAEVGICKSPSGFASGNLSQHGNPVVCSGRTPGYWQTQLDWPAPYVTGTCASPGPGTCSSWNSDGTAFHPLFGGTQYKNSDGTSKTLMQVLWLNGNGDPSQLGAHIVAALLNAKKEWTPVLNESQVIGIWNEYVTKGYFEPTAGVQWDAAKIVSYLKSTMTF
jgi:hypothetical protein